MWNIRGIGHSPSLARIRQLIRIHKCSVVGILEPMIAATRITRRLSMDHYAVSQGETSNIFVMWKCNVAARVVETHSQYGALALGAISDPDAFFE